MELSVGDKVRVYFYPPGSTSSFVEGVVDRTEVKTFYGPCFSLQRMREVVLDREVATPRALPYIIRYQREDDFEGRIEILASVAQPEPELLAQPEADPAIEADPIAEDAHAAVAGADVTAAEPEVAEEPEAALEVQQASQRWGWRRLFGRAA
jgi:hypothetical protein